MKNLTLASILIGLGVAISVTHSSDGYQYGIPDKSVIDHHAHVACYGYQSDCYISKSISKSYKNYLYQYLFDFTEKEAKAKGDAHIFKKTSEKIGQSHLVKQAVILAIDQVYSKDGEVKKDLTEFYVPNTFVAENVKKYSNLLYGASVHPYRNDALEMLEWAKAQGAVLVKLLPAIHHFSANDPSLKPYYKKLVELDLPLLIHMDEEHSFSRAAHEYSNPEFLELPLSLGVNVICAHAASNGATKDGTPFYQTLVELSKKYDNLWTDNSALTIVVTRKNHLQKALPYWKTTKILYGSDYPLNSELLTSPWFYSAQIGFKKAWEISGIQNPWDRDIALKLELGLLASTLKNQPFVKIEKSEQD